MASNLEDDYEKATKCVSTARENHKVKYKVVVCLKEMQAKKASDLIKKKSGRNSQSQKDVQRLTYAQRKRKLQRQQIVDSKNGKINEVDGVLKEEKYRTLINQLSGLNLGGLLQLVEALDKKRSLYGIHLSSIDAMYVLCICSVQGEQAHVVSHT